MKSIDVKEKQTRIERMIDCGDVYGVIGALRHDFLCGSGGLGIRVDELEHTYGAMLDFMKSGVVDPQRYLIHNKVLADLFEVLYASIDIEIKSCDNNNLRGKLLLETADVDFERLVGKYFLMLETWQGEGTHVVSKDMCEVLHRMFDVVWLGRLNNRELVVLEVFLNNHEARIEDRGLIVGALLFGVSQRFIPRYINILIGLSLCEHNMISSRALVGLVVSICRHGDRLLLDESLKNRLEMLVESEAYRASLLLSFILLFRSRQTARISQKVNTEIASRMMSSKMFSSDWKMGNVTEMTFDDPKLIKNMNKLSKWQLEGVDVYAASFAHLKDYSFFKHLSGWLMPYDKCNDAIADAVAVIGNEEAALSLVDKLARTSVLCDSDKYSILMTFAYIPKESRESVCKIYASEFSLAGEDDESNIEEIRASFANRYVHDLYRLFYVYGDRGEFIKPLDSMFTLIGKSDLFDMLLTVDDRISIANKLAENEDYEPAMVIYDKILKSGVTDVDMYNKMAYCCVNSKKYAKGLYWIGMAEKLEGETYMSLKMASQCWRAMELYDKEMVVLEKMMALKPDDIEIKKLLALCYEKLDMFEEELRLLYEIDYYKPSSDVALYIGRCMLRLGKLSKVKMYVDRAFESGLEGKLLGVVEAICDKNISRALEIMASMPISDIDLLVETYDMFRLSYQSSNVSMEDVRSIRDIIVKDMESDAERK